MIPFNSLQPLHTELAAEIEAAVGRVLASGWYILGPEVEAFENEFAAYHGVGHAVGVANGTDAIELALRAADIGPGDEVITVSHTAIATVRALERTGARPVFADIDELTYTLDADAAAAAITPRTRAILPVHLYGHPAALEPLVHLARRRGLLLLEDCAQAHGARYDGRPVGTFGHMAAFSFYPTKNLGAYGDGGAILTDDGGLAERLRRLRNYGQTVRDTYVERGVNSRLDEVQAAILRVKLRYLDRHNARRRTLASGYESGRLRGPHIDPRVEHVHHLHVVRLDERDALREGLHRRGVATLVHYPTPVHLQASHADLDYPRGSLPVTEKVVREILSLPLFIGLREKEIRTVNHAIASTLDDIGHDR